MSDIKRGGAARNAKLAGLGAGMAGRAALGFGKRLTGKSRDEVNAELMDKAAQQLFTVLGELKGGAMKVGQALVGHGGRDPRAVRQAVPRGADQAAARGPAAARRQGAPGARRATGHQVARTVRLLRRQAGGVGQHRPGAQGGLVGRPRRRRQDPVPGCRRGAARRPEDHAADGQRAASSSPPAPTCRAWSTS